MDDNQILKRAEQLMIDKKYQQARSLLEVLEDHPQAMRWIAKIDEIKARDELATLAPNHPVSPNQPLFEKQKPKLSPISRAVRELVLLMVGFFAVVVISLGEGNLLQQVFTLLNIDTVYEDSRIRVKHPALWESLPVKTSNWCKSIPPETSCLYRMIRASETYQAILVLHIALNDTYSAGELAEFNWVNGLNDRTYVRRNLRRQAVTIAGLPGVAQFYVQEENDNDAGFYYTIDIYLTNGLDGYIVHIDTTNSQCEMAQSIEEVNEILSTLEVVRAEGGYTSSSPVQLEIKGCD